MRNRFWVSQIRSCFHHFIAPRKLTDRTCSADHYVKEFGHRSCLPDKSDRPNPISNYFIKINQSVIQAIHRRSTLRAHPDVSHIRAPYNIHYTARKRTRAEEIGLTFLFIFSFLFLYHLHSDKQARKDDSSMCVARHSHASHVDAQQITHYPLTEECLWCRDGLTKLNHHWRTEYFHSMRVV